MKNRLLLPTLLALAALSSGCLTDPSSVGVKHSSFMATVRIQTIRAAAQIGPATPVEIAPADIESRINAFVEAIDDRTDPDVNRVLGDGARVLRLCRDQQRTTKEDATSLFVAAVYMGFDDVAAKAVALGADVNRPSRLDSLERPAILVALQYGTRCKDVAWLKNVSLDVRDAAGRGVIHYAVGAGNADALSVLLGAKCDATTPDKLGVTPLALASELGYLEMVKALFPVSDPAIVDEDGMTALLRAALRGRLDIVKFLHEKDRDLVKMVSEDDVGKFGVVELAARAAAQSTDRNSHKLLEWLLDDLKFKPTPRSVTERVVAGDVRTLKTLVSHGGVLLDSFLTNDGRRIPGHLAVAVRNKKPGMVRYLVSHGLDVNDPAVLDAVSDTGDDEIAEFLRENGLRKSADQP